MSKARCISLRRIGCLTVLALRSSISSTNLFCHALLSQSQHHRHGHSSNFPFLPPSLLSPKSYLHSSTKLHHAKPKRGNIVDSYQTVSVNCNSCKSRLFRYKKKNGTKSNLIKCYVERIVYEDPEGVLEQQFDNFAELSEGDHKWCCPKCGVNFGRSSLIHGMPAIKLVGGKTRMTKK